MRATCSHCGAEVTLAPESGSAKQRCGFCGGTVSLPPQFAQTTPSLFRVYRIPIVVFVVLVFVGSVGIFALFVPEMKFRRAMEQGRAAETAGQWKTAAEYYRVARDLRANGAGVDDAIKRVTAHLSQPSATMIPQKPPPAKTATPVPPPATAVAVTLTAMGITHPLGKTNSSFPATYYVLPSDAVTLKLNSSARPPVTLPVGTYATAQQARDFIAQHFAAKIGGDFVFDWRPPSDPSSDKWWMDMCGEIPDRYTKAPPEAQPNIYMTLTRHFLVADYLLEHPDYAARRHGFGILLEVLIKASGKLEDKPLCVALGDLVLAKLDCADPSQPSSIGIREGVERAVYAHRKFGDRGRIKLSYMRMIELGDYYDNRNMSDFARLQLARACLDEGDRETARRLAEEIDPNSGIGGGKQEILRALERSAPQQRRRHSP